MDTLKLIFSLWRFGVAFLIVAALTWLAHMYLPPQHNAFRPLHLDHPIGFATYGKFTNLKYDRETCFKALDQVGIQYTPLEDQETGRGCGFKNALTLDRSLTPYSATISMTCPMTAALYTWERHAAQPLAEELLGTPLARIETYGAYSCRNISGSRRRSEHATANAIDVAGFHLSDGRYISIQKHWESSGPEGKYLRRLHKEACRLFSVTLGPDYNAAHQDHFHFDFGSSSSCR